MSIKNKGKLVVFLGAAAALAVSLIKDKKSGDSIQIEEENSEEKNS